MKKSIRNLIASMAAFASIFATISSVSAYAAGHNYSGSLMNFESTCSSNSPYSVTAEIYNKSGSTKYMQCAIYSGNSYTTLTPKNSNGGSTQNYSMRSCSKSGITDSIIQTYGNCYGDSTPYSAVVESHTCYYVYGTLTHK